MNAKRARELSDYNLKIVTTKEYEEVLSKIIQAVEKGEYNLSYGYVSSNCIKRLQNDGYQVTSDSHRNETVTFITW